jgi:hypothetical protein
LPLLLGGVLNALGAAYTPYVSARHPNPLGNLSPAYKEAPRCGS